MTPTPALWKSARAYLLYGAIAASGYLCASDYTSREVKFWSGFVGAVCLAWKALGSKPASEPPPDSSDVAK